MENKQGRFSSERGQGNFEDDNYRQDGKNNFDQNSDEKNVNFAQDDNVSPGNDSIDNTSTLNYSAADVPITLHESVGNNSFNFDGSDMDMDDEESRDAAGERDWSNDRLRETEWSEGDDGELY